MIKYFLLLGFVGLITFSSASAYRGENYDDTILGNGSHLWTSQPEWMYSFSDSNGKHYAPYLLSNTSSIVQVLSPEGSFVFDKNTCAITFYEGNNTNNVVIKSDSYVVKSNLNGTQVWNNVNVINNAACQTSINQTGNDIEVIGTKSVAGAGTFKIHYIKQDGQKLKTTLEATNQNPAWTNFHIGTTETLQVPRIITLGNQTYDLSQFNGTVLDRNWINNHRAQMVALSNKVNFDFTLAYNYVTRITILWSGSQASLAIDYTNNTPILQPGHTISVDPTFGFTSATYKALVNANEASATCTTHSAAYSSNGALFVPQASTVSDCQISTFRWDISSIPPNSGITQISLKTTMSTVTTASNCDYIELPDKPETATAAQIYNDMGNHTTYILQNSAHCTAGGTYTDVVSSAAQSTLLTQLPFGWYAIGVGQVNYPTRAAGAGTQTNVLLSSTPLQLQIIWQPLSIYVHAVKSDGSNVTPGNVIRTNSSGTNTYPLNSTGWALVKSSQTLLQNFTLKDTNINFVTFKQYNYNATSNSTLTFNSYDFLVDCPSTGTGNDLELWTNGTDGHRISSFPSPTCFANNTVKWHPYFKANGKSGTSYNTLVKVRVLNGTFMLNPTSLKANSTTVTTSLSVPYITSNSITVGTGLQNIGIYFSMNLGTATRASAPQSLTATAVSTSQINLAWIKPNNNGTYPLVGYKIIRNGTTLTNNTGTLLTTYNDAGISSGHLETYNVCGWTLAGCGNQSNSASDTTWEAISGATILVNKTIVGDAIEVTPYITYTKGVPAPTITQEKLFNKTITRVTNSTMNHVTSGRNVSVYGPGLYDAYLSSSNSNYTMSVRLTNSVGAVNITSTNSTGNVQKGYTPTYFTATDPSQGFVNYTITRSSNQQQLTLNVNRQLSGAVFPLNCKYQTSFEAQFNTGGFWVNHSSIGFGHYTSTVSPTQNYYVTCYDGLLFTATGYFNGSAALYGIAAFDTTYGAFLGVPAGVFFLVMAASLGNRRTAPMWVVIILAIAGLMATIGFFSLDQNVWYLAIIAGLLGLLVGRKLF